MTLLLLRLHLWSWRNRLRTRLRRLRQPKYLLSFAVGVSYVLTIWRPWSRGRAVRIGGAPIPVDVNVVGAVEVGLAVLISVYLVVSWLWPRFRPALRFTETEIAFLFPAPLHRRQVVNYSLLRSQLGLLFGALMVSLFAVRQFAPSFWQGLLGTWLAFSTLQMVSLGTAITRSSLLSHGTAAWRRRLPLAVVCVGVVGAVFLWGRYWLRPPTAVEAEGPVAMAGYFVTMADSGPMRYLLMPARLLVRPALVEGGVTAFGLALLPALALLALSYLWVIRSDFAYEEASAERAAKRAAWRRDRRTRRRRYERLEESKRRPPFRLGESGRPEVALLWKNLIASGRLLTARRALVLLVGAVALAAGVQRLTDGTPWEPVPQAFGTAALIFAGMMWLFGPLLTRSDLRSDLLFASTLKTWPLPGWSLVFGETLAPTLLVSYFQVLFVSVAMVLVPVGFAFGPADRLLLILAAAILAVPLNLLSVLVQAATVLTFPSWLTLGPERARGFEAIGQRIVAMVARLFVLAVAFLPAAAILGLVLLFTYQEMGNAALPLAAALAVLPALVESAFGLFLLGIRFDHFDPAAELDVST